jgi:fluoride exporter
MSHAVSRSDQRAPETAAAPPVDLQRRPHHLPWLTLAVIAVGGVAGALARQGLWAAFPPRDGMFDWTTFCINVGGCGLIGVLMTSTAGIRRAHRLTRPFLGTGVLGGFTTFSTYIVEIQRSIAARSPGTGLAYLGLTLVAALLAVQAGAALARLLQRPLRRARP